MNALSIEKLISDCESRLKDLFTAADDIALKNQKKTLDAFRKEKIALRHFNGSTGYGYGDDGRDALKRVYADVFNTESAVVSPNIVSGTHALSVALYALLKPGDRILFISGEPYDTLKNVVDSGEYSLRSLGVVVDYVPLKNGAVFDYEKIEEYLKYKPDMIYVQRSRGYDEREAISVEEIGNAKKFINERGFSGIYFVDNCYGEFVEDSEPTDVGADICCGSLIKNIGGGIAPTGGYVVGKKNLCEKIEARLTSPSIAGEVGSYAFGYQYFYQGLFIAPHVVCQAVKGSLLIGAALSELGFSTIPNAYKTPYDITRSVVLKTKENLIKFVQAVQQTSPIDSFVSVEPSEMPGYEHQVVMAAGCFIQGSSIELSADAPIKEPYNVFIQGGLTYEHVKLCLKEILSGLEI